MIDEFYMVNFMLLKLYNFLCFPHFQFSVQYIVRVKVCVWSCNLVIASLCGLFPLHMRRSFIAHTLSAIIKAVDTRYFHWHCFILSSSSLSSFVIVRQYHDVL